MDPEILLTSEDLSEQAKFETCPNDETHKIAANRLDIIFKLNRHNFHLNFYLQNEKALEKVSQKS